MTIGATTAVRPTPPASPAAGPARMPRLPKPMTVLLATLIFTAFLTGTRFIPVIRNNVGPFELVGGILVLYFALFLRDRPPIRGHPLISVVAVMVTTMAVSQVLLPATHRLFGLLQVLSMVYLLALMIVVYNLGRSYPIDPGAILKVITFAVLVIGPWVFWQGVQSGGDVQEAGPFRNRAHMGTYMLTAFWMVLAYSLWPGIRQLNKRLAQVAVLFTLYAVAVSGRRSVYLSLIFGLAALGVSFILARRGKRLSMIASGVLVIGFLALFYTYGERWVPQARFFRERVGMIDDRVREAVDADEQSSEGGSFFAMQRQGVELAFRSNPLLGIGWGGFPRSAYSPTGHGVHSTPLRFLAELGLLGLTLYGLFMLLLLKTVTGLAWRFYRTPWGPSCLTLALGLWTMTVSYIYNRHLTERTFWLLLIVVLTLVSFRPWRAPAARGAGGWSGGRPLDRGSPEPGRPAAGRRRGNPAPRAGFSPGATLRGRRLGSWAP